MGNVMQYYRALNRGGVPAAPAFISTWRTTNTVAGGSASNQIRLPLVNSGVHNFTVDWGDGNSDVITVWNQTERTHTYAATGDYTVTITGVMGGMAFTNGTERLKILTISQWGVFKPFGDSLFWNCTNLNITASDIPDLSLGTTFNQWFRGCSSLVFNSSINSWDVSGITIMANTFQGCSLFNRSLNNWDVSNVTNFSSCFISCIAFNQNIDNWDVSSGINFSGMFSACTAFNQTLNSWDVSNGTNFSGMFYGPTAFNQSLNSWDVSSGTSFNSMFGNMSSFNGNITSWDVSSGTDFFRMFFLSPSFNQNISGWDMSAALTVSEMFRNATSFNQNIASWNVSNVTNFSGMFWTTNFNQNIGSWNVGKGTNFANMFNGSVFNQNIGSWNVSKANNFTNFMAGKAPANFSAANLDAIYNGWSTLTFVNTGLVITFNTIKYTASGSTGKAVLTGSPNNWTITDGGI